MLDLGFVVWGAGPCGTLLSKPETPKIHLTPMMQNVWGLVIFKAAREYKHGVRARGTILMKRMWYPPHDKDVVPSS